MDVREERDDLRDPDRSQEKKKGRGAVSAKNYLLVSIPNIHLIKYLSIPVYSAT